MNFFASARVIAATFSKYRWYLSILVVIGFLGAILEGIGINAAIPLISFFMGATGTPADFISQAIQSLFNFFSIPFTFRYLLGFILALFMLRAVAMVAFGYIRGLIMADFQSAEGQTMFRSTLLSSWPFLLKQKIGHLQNTLTHDLDRASNLLQVVSQLIQSFTGFLMYLLIALNISSFMTMLTLVGGGVLLFIVRPLLAKTQIMAAQAARTEKDISQFLTEHISGIKSVKAAGVELLAYNFGKQLLLSVRQIHLKMTLVRSLNTSLFQPFSIIFIVVLFYVMYQTPGFSIVAFGAALYLIQKIFLYLESLQSSLHSISELAPYATQVSQFKQVLEDNHETHREGGTVFAFNREIEFKNISFGYEGKEYLLRGLSCAIKKGETIGIVGPSGAGKTSVADLLLRLFVPNEGVLTIDGVSAADIPVDVWRAHIGYVSQDVFLLNASVADNIRFYREGISDEQVVEAARKANILDVIESLPDAFETKVGDRGVMLSGGQRQRIALARALLGRPEILVLDEATSALDHESEKLIQDSIRSLKRNTTVVIIAHRPSTVADADRIIVLNDGRIVEEGAPDSLLQNNDSYFYKMQHGA